MVQAMVGMGTMVLNEDDGVDTGGPVLVHW